MNAITEFCKFLPNITRRHICNSAIISNIYQNKDDIQVVKKNLKLYLEQESPLKNFDNKDNPWVSSPYPAGTILPENDDVVDIETTSIVMFPGQGNQFVGMGKNLLKYSVVNDMFDAASTILGYDLKKLCLQGPISKLNRTEYCQPATLVCSLAAVEDLKERYPGALNNCIGACGFSVGEMAALVFAGCISFDKAVHITRIRAEAMEICSTKDEGGMMSVLCAEDTNLKGAMADAKSHCTENGIKNPVCTIANYLIPECKIIAGHTKALDFIDRNLAPYRIRKSWKLPVCGAFHTSLMEDAAPALKAALKKIEVVDPIIPVYSNVTGMPYRDAADIVRTLPKQIYKPVKWEQMLHFIYQKQGGKKSYCHTYECGPGKSLSVILRRLNSVAGKNCHQVFGLEEDSNIQQNYDK